MMSTFSRRALLRLLARAGGTLALTGCGAARVRSTAPAPREGTGLATRPHYVVRITLAGGFDSVMSVDPKDAAHTGGLIDPGYTAAERLQGRRRLYGPLARGLVRHDDRLCLVHGVRTDTVDHSDGESMLRAGHQRYSSGTRPFGDLAGELLPGGAPIPHLSIQTGEVPPATGPLDTLYVPENPLSPDAPGGGGLSVDAATTARLVGAGRSRFALPPWGRAVEEVQLEEARQVLGDDPEALAAYQQSLQDAAALRRLLATADAATAMTSPLGPGLQLAFHAIRGNHARFITVRSPRAWFDSHSDNHRVQTARLAPTLDDVGAFVDLLQQERNAFGSLLEQTTLVVSSELGRYPKLNVAQGKDHWPENSWLLLGRGIRSGVTVGATDANFRGVPVDFRSGSGEGDQRRPLFLDGLFATLLHLCGGDVAAQGYARDAVLACVLERGTRSA